MLLITLLALMVFALASPIAKTPDDTKEEKIMVNMFTAPNGGGDAWSVEADNRCHDLQSPVAGNVLSIDIPAPYECVVFSGKRCDSGSKHATVAAPGSDKGGFTKVNSIYCSVQASSDD